MTNTSDSGPPGPRSVTNGRPRQLLDAQEVAALLGFSARHVRRLASEGRIPSYQRFGSLIRWPRLVIDAWLEAGCSRPEDTATHSGPAAPAMPPPATHRGMASTHRAFHGAAQPPHAPRNP